MSKLPVSSLEGGVCFGMPNNVKMQAGPATVVVTCPSMGQVASAKGTAKNVLVRNKEGVLVGSKMPSTQGDEIGKLGGVPSGTQGAEAEYKKGAEKVRMGGKAPATVTSQTEQNSRNVPNGQQISPSQTVVFAS